MWHVLYSSVVLPWFHTAPPMQPLTSLDFSGILDEVLDLPLDRLDGTRLLGLLQLDCASEPARAVRDGFPVETFDRLKNFLGLPDRELAAALPISPRTLVRRRAAGHLSPEESDRLLRLARLAELALAVFEDTGAAAAWLTEPKRLLDGETPLQHADTAPGTREVEDMLYAIEFTMAA